MATKTVVELVDDLDGTRIEKGNDETIRFAVNGVEYEMDLTEDNAAGCHEVMADYIKVARKLDAGTGTSDGSPNRSRTAGRGRDRDQSRAIRDWARSQGLPANERGRIREDVVRAYEAVHR